MLHDGITCPYDFGRSYGGEPKRRHGFTLTRSSPDIRITESNVFNNIITPSIPVKVIESVDRRHVAANNSVCQCPPHHKYPKNPCQVERTGSKANGRIKMCIRGGWCCETDMRLKGFARDVTKNSTSHAALC